MQPPRLPRPKQALVSVLVEMDEERDVCGGRGDANILPCLDQQDGTSFPVAVIAYLRKRRPQEGNMILAMILIVQ